MNREEFLERVQTLREGGVSIRATLERPPIEMQQLLGALKTNQAKTDRFFGTLAGTVPIPEFFDPANMGRIIGADRGWTGNARAM